MVDAIADIHIKPARLTKQRFVAGAAAAVSVTGGLGMAIRLRFHNHAPEQLAIGLPFHQQAADELGGDDLSWTSEEGLGRDRKCWQVAVAIGVACPRAQPISVIPG